MQRQKSILNNAIFNFIKTLANLAFPIVTFSYASRILGATGLGEVNFSSSFVTYFSTLALLGMNYYGVREGAKLRDDKDKFSKFVHEMLIINGITTVMSYFLLAVSMIAVPKLHSYWQLLLIFSVNILFSGMGLDWLYSAIEEYRYITVCSLIFKFVSFIALFLFVHRPEDVIAYSFVQVIATTGSHIVNFIYAKKFVSFKRYQKYEIKKHIKPILWLFAMALSIELYTVLDTTMIGFILDDAAVGRYTAATKINRMVLNTVSSIGYVVMPRFAYYLKNKQIDKGNEIINKLFNYIFMLTVPAAVGLFVLSDEIIFLFSGPDYSSAALTMRILTPIVIIIPMSITINLQIFIPLNKEKLILQSTLSGAITNFIFNMILIPIYAENGAAAATVLAETVVTCVCLFNLRKFYRVKNFFKKYYQYWVAIVPCILIVTLINYITSNYFAHLILDIVFTMISYFGVLFIYKNKYLLDIMNSVLKKFLHN